MSKLAVYGSQGGHVAGANFGGKMAKKGFFAGLKFFAEERGRKIVYHCFFRGRPKGSSSRSEQYFVEYKGELENFKSLVKDIEKVMVEEHGEKFEFAKSEDDFLFDLVKASERDFGFNEKRIRKKLRANDRLEFKAGRQVDAARFVKSLLDIEAHSRDGHVTIGVAENFSKIKEPEVAIKLDDSVRGIDLVSGTKNSKERRSRSSFSTSKSSAGRTFTSSTTSNTGYGSNKPSGPIEWLLRKLHLA